MDEVVYLDDVSLAPESHTVSFVNYFINENILFNDEQINVSIPDSFSDYMFWVFSIKI